MRFLLIPLGALALAACSSEPDNQAVAAAEADQARAAAEAGRIPCALRGSDGFSLNCTLDRMATADGTVLVLGRSDVGYRRFRVMSDGSGLVAADGAEPATVTVVEPGLIEVAVGNDRYRLPANTGGAR